jgi:hypothetical protein
MPISMTMLLPSSSCRQSRREHRRGHGRQHLIRIPCDHVVKVRHAGSLDHRLPLSRALAVLRTLGCLSTALGLIKEAGAVLDDVRLLQLVASLARGPASIGWAGVTVSLAHVSVPFRIPEGRLAVTRKLVAFPK